MKKAILAAILATAVFAVYSPALRGGFVWDDAAHRTRPELRSLHGLGRIWSEPGATQQYYPLLHSFFWLEHYLWGEAALGYHVVNVALHALAAILLALLLQRLALRGAWLAALLFALHPLQVESVAWISEQKNTLSTVFALGAALAYVRFDACRDRFAYAAALTLFLLALLTKTVAATLPAALLVVLWWQRGRLEFRRDVLPLAPWLALGAAAGLFTAWAERALIGAEGVAFDLTLWQRTLLAGRVVWFYLAKLVWPANLSFNYPRWEIGSAAPLPWLPLLAAVGLLLACWSVRRHSRAPLAIALLFGGTLFPVLGFFNVYPFQYSFVADHFAYLAAIPLVTLAGELLRHRARALLLIAPFSMMTWQHSHDFHDSETLFRATLARNPQSWFAHNNLGELLLKSPATLPEALTHLERAVALHPDYPEALNNLGLALTRAGRAAGAVPLLEKSRQLKPQLHQTHNNLGIALASLGRAAEAVEAFARAAQLNPTLPNIHENWAKALLLAGRRAEADEHFAIAARLRGDATALRPSPPPSLPRSP